MNVRAGTPRKRMFWELLLIGGALIVGGVFALLHPKQTLIIILRVLGLVALVSGIVFAARFARVRATSGWRSTISLTLAIFFFLISFFFLVKPSQTSNFLMYLVGFWFIAYAVFALLFAFALRLFHRGLFGVALTIGLILLGVGLVILIAPSILGISIGLLIGIAMLFGGVEFVLLAIGDRLAEKKRHVN